MKEKREILHPDGFWRPITKQEDDDIKQNSVRKDFDIKYRISDDDFRNNEITVIITETFVSKDE